MELRVHQFEHQNRLWTRRELEGHPVVVTEWETMTPWSGKQYPSTAIRWKGLHELDMGSGEPPILAAESLTIDAGPKLGLSLTYVKQPEHPATEEERRLNRKHLNMVLETLFPGAPLKLKEKAPPEAV